MRWLRRAALPFLLLGSAAIFLGSALVPADAAPVLAFNADFSQPNALADGFDFGYSGQNPWLWGNGSGEGAITSFHGDHNQACEAPTTDRTVAFGGDRANLDYSQLFWQCTPGGDPAKGHLMTGVDTVSYNIAWFAPKPTFTNVAKVCWDQNLTTMSHRKWTHVMFVSPSDATKYKAGTITDDGLSQARGSGGYDLGFTEPGFRDKNAPTTGVIPSQANAGLKVVDGGASWWQNDTFTGPSWGDIIGRGYDGYKAFPRIEDKAARYTICVENVGTNQVAISMGGPEGVRTSTASGHIPSGPVRVVFGDDNYNPEKGEAYASDRLTWHWDNVQVFTGAGGTTTTTAAPTTTSTTAAPTTTSTTRPPTTTTTVAPTTTTTVPPTTTSTTTPLPVCDYTETERYLITVCPKG